MSTKHFNVVWFLYELNNSLFRQRLLGIWNLISVEIYSLVEGYGRIFFPLHPDIISLYITEHNSLEPSLKLCLLVIRESNFENAALISSFPWNSHQFFPRRRHLRIRAIKHASSRLRVFKKIDGIDHQNSSAIRIERFVQIETFFYLLNEEYIRRAKNRFWC